jgi:hypothetical protein
MFFIVAMRAADAFIACGKFFLFQDVFPVYVPVVARQA